jgi:transcriptional regulator with XRE-family HTH domain
MRHTNLAEALKASGLTQAQYAALLGLSQSYLSRLVNGVLEPPLHVAVRVAERAGVPVESLVAPRNKPTAA